MVTRYEHINGIDIARDLEDKRSLKREGYTYSD